MWRIRAVSGIVAVSLAVVLLHSSACADEAAPAPTVTLSVADAQVAEVAAQIAAQSGLSVFVLGEIPDTVSLEMEALTVEAAIAALAEGFEGSWVRGYLLETATPEQPYEAEQLLAMMQQVREQWMQTLQALPEDQRREMMGAMFGGRGQRGGPRGGQQGGPQGGQQGGQQGGPGGGEQAGAPGQAPAEAGAPGQAPGQDQNRRGRMMRDDPLRGLMRPGRDETVSLELADSPLSEALAWFFGASGYIAIAPEVAEMTITASVTEAPIGELLDQFAASLQAQWRPFYMLCKPQELTQEQMEQRAEQGFQRGMGQLWQMTPEDRSARISRMVDRMTNMSQRLKDAPPERRQRMQSRFNRMFGRMTQYSAGLTPEQRKELKPLLRAMGQLTQQ